MAEIIAELTKHFDRRTIVDVILNGELTRSGRHSRARTEVAQALRAHGVIIPNQPAAISSLRGSSDLVPEIR